MGVSPQPVSTPQRLAIPTRGQLRQRARAAELAAKRTVWSVIATEAAEMPTSPGIGIDDLADALDCLGRDWDWLTEQIERLRAAQQALAPIDVAKARQRLAAAEKAIPKAHDRAVAMRAKAAELEREAQAAWDLALHQLDEEQRVEREAAELFQQILQAGAPGDIDYGLRARLRVVRCTRPTIEGECNLDPGDLMLYGGPPRPWFEDYTGDVQLDEHGRGHDPLTLPTVNEVNERIAAEVEAQARQFEGGGLPGVEIHHRGEPGHYGRIEITSRPTRADDFPDDAPSPLPTHAEVTMRPSNCEPSVPANQPQLHDPWGFDEE